MAKGEKDLQRLSGDTTCREGAFSILATNAAQHINTCADEYSWSQEQSKVAKEGSLCPGESEKKDKRVLVTKLTQHLLIQPIN